VRAYALRQGKKNGWDIVVSTWTDLDIDRVIGKRTKSVMGAVQMMVQTGGFREQAAR
jgi:hypothetical protein